MQKKQKAKKENSERWLLTYSDLITLLMILFILLYAMSNVNQAKYAKLAKSLNNTLGNGTSASVLNGAAGVLPGKAGKPGKSDNTNAKTVTPKPSSKVSPTTAPQASTAAGSGNLSGYLKTKSDMEHLQTFINKVLTELKMSDYVNTEVKEYGLVTTFSNDVIFDSGDDRLKPEMITGLKKLAPLLRSISNSIVVEGYTDNIPITKASKFSSNWQLSSARAANVAEFLVDHCDIDGSRISSVGYSKYHPKASNDTATGRSKNRRIEIVILYNQSTYITK